MAWGFDPVTQQWSTNPHVTTSALQGWQPGSAIPPAFLEQMRQMYANGQGGEYTDPATGYNFAPNLTDGRFNGGTLYQIQGKGDYKTPGYVFDAQGNATAPGFQIEHSAPSFMDNYGWMLPLAAAGGAAAMGLGAGAGAGAAAGGTAAVDTSVMGAGAGLGSSGTGLTLGGGTTGLTAGTGTGLSLAGNAVAPGMMTAAAPGASAIGAGLGTGLAAGVGSLLGPAALAGTTTLSSGSILPAAASAASTAAGGLSGAASGLAGAPNWLGPAATVAGGLLGSQGSNNSATSNRELPAYLQAPVTDLVGRTQGLLDSQMGPAGTAGSQMVTQGTGLMGAQVAGNGVGKVTLNSPNTPTNPYLSGLADDISRRTQRMLGQNNLSIAGRANMSAGTGSTRQGVAQGVAAGQASDYLSGNLASLYGTAYNNDQNRALQQYGMDQGFYTGQRGQDLAQVGVGSGLVNQGFQTQFQPLTQASQVYSPFSGMGSTTTSQNVGGGIGGALGGALGMAQLGKNAGWWG